MDDGPLGSGPLNHEPLGLLGGLGSPASGDSDSSDGSSSGSTSSPPSPPTLSSPESSSTPSAPPPESSSGASPSPPSPPLSPPPAPPAGGGSPLLQVSAPGGSNAIPSPEAPKHGGGGGGSSSEGGSSKGGSGGRGKSGSGSRDGSAPPVAAVVVGVVIGVLAFGLLLAIAACVCCARRKKKPRHPPHMNMPYYTDQNGNVYYANSMPKWQNSGAVDVQGRGMGWQPQYSPGQGPPLSEEMTSGTQSHGTGGTPPPPSPAMALGFGAQSSFTYDELAAGTGGFAQANLLGQGGFGFVYKGVLPGSGKEVAVKQLKAGSGQGEREFQAEVEIISRVHHRHLVSLVGYCIAGSSQRLLVYEFVPNDTLERHLHGKGVSVMNWPRRLAIALGSAKGLAYLHEDCHPRIIHRDIKAANILLDENFDAKVADFGLAKLTTDNNTHVSTRVMGTFGYLAPEYASSGKLTDKSDVFSFGVMMLELITGRRPVDTTNHMEDSLVDWARPLLAQALSEGGSFDELIDPRLENRYDRSEMERMAAAAAAAVRHSAKRRPKMKQIVRALEGDASLDDLHDGVKPGQSMMFSSGSEGGSGGNYASDINRLRQIAFESSEEYSNEYSESGDTARRHH